MQTFVSLTRSHCLWVPSSCVSASLGLARHASGVGKVEVAVTRVRDSTVKLGPFKSQHPFSHGLSATNAARLTKSSISSVSDV